MEDQPQGLTGNEQRLYEFIVRSFLACCSKDAQGQETIVTIDIANEKFSANGLMITARNYLDVYPYDKWSSKEIHVYQAGQEFNPTSIDMAEGSTSPPNLLTEADLIALMEKHGIGTDATHADHIETIKNRSYVALADAIHFVPSLLGMGLVEGYDAMGLNISKPHLRAQLEADLKAISEGRKDPKLVLAEQVAKYKEVYITITAEANKIDSALAERFSERPVEYTPTTEIMPVNMPSVLKCPKCGMDMNVRQKKNNADEFYISCVSYPQCKNAVWLPSSIVKSLEVLPDTCPTCGPNYKKIKFEWRNNTISHLYPTPYTACIGGCDSTLLEFLQINRSSVRPVNANRNQVHASNITRENSMNNVARQTNRANQNTNQIRPAPQPRNNIQPNSNVRMPVPNATSTNTFLTPNTSNGSDNNVLCQCNMPAILLTVRKQNENFGKKFYKCQKMKDNGGCDFFLWAPESVDNSQSHLDTPPPSTDTLEGPSGSNNASLNIGWGTASFRSNSDNTTDDNVQCNCGLPSKKLTVYKEGPNKGRQFYGCPNEFNKRCNFFQWADSGSSHATSNTETVQSSSTRGRGRGAAGGSRRCGICRQEGHNRNRCPNAN